MKRKFRRETAWLMGSMLTVSVMNPFVALAEETAKGPGAFLETPAGNENSSVGEQTGDTIIIVDKKEEHIAGGNGPASMTPGQTPGDASQNGEVGQPQEQPPQEQQPQEPEIPEWKKNLPPYTGYETGDTSTQAQGQGVTLQYERGQGSNITNVTMTLDNPEGISALSYRTYVNVTYDNKGLYLPYLLNGLPSGGTEDSTYVEAVAIELTGDMAKTYDVWYSMTVSGYGQLGWAKNGELAGAMDIREHIISMDVRILPKGSEAPGSTAFRLLNPYSGRLNIQEGATTCVNEDGTPYQGWVDQDYKSWYFENGVAAVGWKTIDGLRLYFAPDGHLVENVDDLIGKQNAYQIRVNKTLNCMTIYAKDEAGNFVIPVKSCLTSVGDDTPLGTYKTPEKYRWRLMVNDTYTQYATRITKGFLIHSPTYNTANKNDLIVNAYNRMGQTRSLGCVRVVTGEAKWIYDRCKLGTEVVIYEDAEKPGPFHLPTVVPVNEQTTYDPTDPAIS